MTQEQTKELLPIITAHAEGKTIQVTGEKGCWFDTESPTFALDPSHYRVKPEPREWWIAIPTQLGYAEPLCDGSRRRIEVVEFKPTWAERYWTFTKVREVL